MLESVIAALVAAVLWIAKASFKMSRDHFVRTNQVTDKFMAHVDKTQVTQQVTNEQLGKIADRLDEVARYQKSNHAELKEGAACKTVTKPPPRRARHGESNV